PPVPVARATGGGCWTRSWQQRPPPTASTTGTPTTAPRRGGGPGSGAPAGSAGTRERPETALGPPPGDRCARAASLVPDIRRGPAVRRRRGPATWSGQPRCPPGSPGDAARVEQPSV